MALLISCRHLGWSKDFWGEIDLLSQKPKETYTGQPTKHEVLTEVLTEVHVRHVQTWFRQFIHPVSLKVRTRRPPGLSDR